MRRTLLRAKVHRIAVTQCELDYPGSLTLDRELMDAAAMVPFEAIDVYNVTNGERFSTYLIEGEPGSGVCCLNGAAAHKVELGHLLIIACYASFEESEVEAHEPKIVLIGEDNRILAEQATEEHGVAVPPRAP